MNRFYICIILICVQFGLNAQSDVQKLVASCLEETPLYTNLKELCDKAGGRITGTKANEFAVNWALAKFKEAGVSAELMPFEMPKKWVPGETTCIITGNEIRFEAKAVSKYMSPPGRHNGKLIYIDDVDREATKEEARQLKNNFLLVSSELCLDISGLFEEYAFAAKCEAYAIKHGAKGIIFMSSRPQKLLYTFIAVKGIQNEMPFLIMSREDAMRCIRLIESGVKLNIESFIQAEVGQKFKAHNVIGEIKGYEKPEEIIIIGAHIDSWALGTGANDNGCNVAMMIDIARQMKKSGIKPIRTIRFALWNGEEQGYFGSNAYTKANQKSLDKHKMALSVDIGSGAITGFFTNGRPELIGDIEKVLEPVYGLGPFTHIDAPIVGTDNFDFMLEGVPNLVANHLSASYGMNYHAESDTYDKVDLASLKRNTAIVAALTLGLANADLGNKNWNRNTRKEVDAIFLKHKTEFAMRMFDVWQDWVLGRRGLNISK